MLELTVTALCPDVAPTVIFDKPNYVADLHATPGLTIRLSSAWVRRRRTKPLDPHHRPLLDPTKMIPRVRSNRWLGAAMP